MESELKEIDNTITKLQKYPYIGRYTDKNKDYNVCVLFRAPNTGMVINCGSLSDYGIGDYRTDWVEDNFEVLPSTTQLSLHNS